MTAGRRPSATFVVHDLGANYIGPVVRMARYLQPEFDVRIAGPCLWGEPNAMYRREFPFTVVDAPRIYRFPDFFAGVRKLADAATGDLLVVMKAFAPALPAALLAKRRRGARVAAFHQLLHRFELFSRGESFVQSNTGGRGKLDYAVLREVLDAAADISAPLIPRGVGAGVHRDKGRQSDPTVNRRAGFMDYILQKYPSCDIHIRFIDSTDKDMTMATLEAFFREHPDVRHIAMFNSRVHLLVPFLERYPDPSRRVVAFDNLPANMAALRRGTVSVLIGQHPEEQVGRAVQALADYILLGRLPQKKDNSMHMDILTPYNVD